MRPYVKRMIRAGLGLIVPWIFLAGCGPSTTPVEEATAEKVLILGNGSEPKNLDPHTVTGVTENKIITALMEGLIAYAEKDDNVLEPGMARHWESDARARVWTFHLRDARWSNEDPVTAGDFVYSWRRMLTPELGAEYADMLYILENGEAYHKGEIEDFSEVGVEAIDDKTLKVTLVGPTPYFPSMLKHYSWFPVNPRTIEAFDAYTDRSSEWVRPGNYVGNGPFILKRWETNTVVEVVRNPAYWDADTVKLNGILFLPIENADTEERTFRAGQLHHANTVPLDKIDAYRNDPDPDVRALLRIEPYLGNYFYRFNVTRPPLDNPKVRQALNWAIDRESLVTNVTRGGQQPATSFTPPGMKGYEPPNRYGHDPDRARELLAEAGYPGGEGIRELEILINTSESHRTIAEAIQRMWKETLGIDVSIVNQEWKVYLDSQSNLDYDISRSGWIGDYMDPVTFLKMWTTGNGNNDTGWGSPVYDELIAASRQEADQSVRYDLMRRAETILLEEGPIMPIYIYTRNYLLHPDVRHWYPKLLDNRHYKFIDLVDADGE
ncbi:MAG: peptide ABC transporter substrate-binding protein [Opitutales bacterium]